jgi:hypothetical protein
MRHAYEMRAHEVHAHEMHAREVHAHEIYAREVHAYEVHAREMYARGLHAYKMHAHERKLLLRNTDNLQIIHFEIMRFEKLPPNLTLLRSSRRRYVKLSSDV